MVVINHGGKEDRGTVYTAVGVRGHQWITTPRRRRLRTLRGDQPAGADQQQGMAAVLARKLHT